MTGGDRPTSAGAAKSRRWRTWAPVWVSVAFTFLLEVPQSLVALVELDASRIPQFVFAALRILQYAAALVAAASVLFISRRRTTALWRALEKWAVSFWANLRYRHQRCPNPEVQFPFYRELITRQLPMLRISVDEVAAALRVSRGMAQFISTSPGFILHEELLPELCRVALVPPDWPVTGGDYGDENVIARLRRYQALGITRVWTMERLAQSTPGARRTAVKRLEKELTETEPQKLLRKEGHDV